MSGVFVRAQMKGLVQDVCVCVVVVLEGSFQELALLC